jgi:putative heme-binding domain-containing protein
MQTDRDAGLHTSISSQPSSSEPTVSRTLVLWLAAIPLVALGLGLPRVAADPDPAKEAEDDALVPLIALLAEIDDEATRLDVLQGIDAALLGRRRLGVPAGWPALHAQLVRSENAEIRRLTTRIALAFGDEAAMRTLRDLAANPERPAAERATAIASLTEIADRALLPVLLRLLDDEAVRGAAIRALAAYDDERIPPAIVARYANLDPAAKREAIAALSARTSSAVVLLETVGDGTIPSRDLSAFDARHLASLEDATVTRLLGEVWGEVRPPSRDRERLLKEYGGQLTPDLLARADLPAGRAVFQKTCAGCHRLFDDGREVGPDLTGSQRYNVDYVLQNLLDPNALIGRDYRVTILVTESGRIVSGLVAEESDDAIVMRTATETLTVPAAEITVRKESEVSMMPEGMLQKLTEEERRNLVAYLAAPAQVPLPQRPADD